MTPAAGSRGLANVGLFGPTPDAATASTSRRGVRGCRRRRDRTVQPAWFRSASRAKLLPLRGDQRGLPLQHQEHRAQARIRSGAARSRTARAHCAAPTRPPRAAAATIAPPAARCAPRPRSPARAAAAGARSARRQISRRRDVGAGGAVAERQIHLQLHQRGGEAAREQVAERRGRSRRPGRSGTVLRSVASGGSSGGSRPAPTARSNARRSAASVVVAAADRLDGGHRAARQPGQRIAADQVDLRLRQILVVALIDLVLRPRRSRARSAPGRRVSASCTASDSASAAPCRSAGSVGQQRLVPDVGVAVRDSISVFSRFSASVSACCADATALPEVGDLRLRLDDVDRRERALAAPAARCSRPGLCACASACACTVEVAHRKRQVPVRLLDQRQLIHHDLRELRVGQIDRLAREQDLPALRVDASRPRKSGWT